MKNKDKLQENKTGKIFINNDMSKTERDMQRKITSKAQQEREKDNNSAYLCNAIIWRNVTKQIKRQIVKKSILKNRREARVMEQCYGTGQEDMEKICIRLKRQWRD